MKVKDNKFLIKLILFCVFWAASLISICVNFSFWTLFFELLVYLPVTLCMLINKDVPALLILILYSAFNIILNSISFIAAIVNNTFKVMQIAYIIIVLLYNIGVIVLSISVLRNKPKMNNLYIIILTLAFLMITIIDFIVSKTYKFYDWVILISNVALPCLTCVYFIYLEEKEREIFK